MLGAAGGRPLGAQTPAPARPDTARADTIRADTARRPTPRDSTPRDSVPRDSAARAAARADSLRRTVSDSAQRDSVIARQLRAARQQRGEAPPRFSLDRLRLSAVGASGGVAAPDQVRAAPLYAVWADYGEVARDLRAVFGLMFWTSQFRGAAVDEFARAVAAVVATPDGQPATVTLGRVRASDVALHADLRYRPRIIAGWRTPGALRPWAGAGVAVHFMDVQGAPISGTFVERALDGLAAGGAASLGLDLVLTPSVQVTGQGRYDLFSGTHFASARAGVSYIFDRRGR